MVSDSLTLSMPTAAPNIAARDYRRLSVTYRQLDELKPDPKNPRKHTAKQVRQIANSIREFGFVGVILVDREGNVIAGHGRLLAARERRSLWIGVTPVNC